MSMYTICMYKSHVFSTFKRASIWYHIVIISSESHCNNKSYLKTWNPFQIIVCHIYILRYSTCILDIYACCEDLIFLCPCTFLIPTPHAMVHLSCTKFLPPCPTRTHANRCQHQLPWAKHPCPSWNTNPPLSVRSCPTIQKTRCLMMGQTWICGSLSRNAYFEAKCLSVLAGRFVEVLQFPPVTTVKSEVRWLWGDCPNIILPSCVFVSLGYTWLFTFLSNPFNIL